MLDSPSVFSLLAPCNVALDLYFAIDSTNTLTEAGHTTMKKWAVDLVDAFPLNTSSNPAPLDEVTRVEVIQFWANGVLKRNACSQAVVDINLGDYNSKEDLENKINSLRFNGSGNTIISHALALLNKEIHNPKRKTYVLVLTDGRDDSTPTNRELANINPKPRTLKEEADILHNKSNVTVFAIGFKDYCKPNLTTIASSEDDVIIDRDLDNALNRTYNRLITNLCGNSGVILRPTKGEFNRCVGE